MDGGPVLPPQQIGHDRSQENLSQQSGTFQRPMARTVRLDAVVDHDKRKAALCRDVYCRYYLQWFRAVAVLHVRVPSLGSTGARIDDSRALAMGPRPGIVGPDAVSRACILHTVRRLAHTSERGPDHGASPSTPASKVEMLRSRPTAVALPRARPLLLCDTTRHDVCGTTHNATASSRETMTTMGEAQPPKYSIGRPGERRA
ncbi:hypothetical protein ACCO45_005805 [Purpureocillium lilacinum]|uniref:Uncharacterized protein n=1 Tax=Purpureocillium lilacinum TaxID=33203 RepID=A0ACC4DX71_PURLI